MSYRQSRLLGPSSQDQHGVAVAVEAIFLLDGLVVGAADQFVAAESPHQDQERRKRQVKIRHHRVNGPERVARFDEQVRFAGEGMQPVPVVRRRFEDANRGRADGFAQ